MKNRRYTKKRESNKEIIYLFITWMTWIILVELKGLPWWLSGKESTCNAGDAEDAGSIPGLGRCPGKGHGNPTCILPWRIQRTEKSGSSGYN